MALEAVQKNNSRTSYVKAAAIGALTGYSLKYLLPVTPQEKDENFKTELKAVKASAKKVKSAQIETIRKSKNKSSATDTFIRMYDNKKLTPAQINKLNKPLKKELFETIKKINKAGRIKKANARETLTALTKHIRPTSVFVITGLAFGLVIAIFNNISKEVTKNN